MAKKYRNKHPTSSQDGTVTVMALIAVPSQKLAPGDTPREPGGIPLKIEAGVDAPTLERVRTAAAALIEGITGEAPKWLGTCRAFLVNASREQVDKIAASPLIKAVQQSELLR